MTGFELPASVQVCLAAFTLACFLFVHLPWLRDLGEVDPLVLRRTVQAQLSTTCRTGLGDDFSLRGLSSQLSDKALGAGPSLDQALGLIEIVSELTG